MRKAAKRALVLGGIAALMGNLWAQNNWLDVEHIPYLHPDIPKEFSGYRIAHLSDLHNKTFGTEQTRLVNQLEQSKPDIIVMTGDLIDTTETEHAITLAEQAAKIAPVYYVSGNHELRFGMQDVMRQQLTAVGVRVLDDELLCLNRGDAKIVLAGAQDPASYVPSASALQKKPLAEQREAALEQMLCYLKTEMTAVNTETPPFSILLAHHPEYLPYYEAAGFSLVLSGHAHGGQFRLPFVGGVMSPGQGAFPRYTSGLYRGKSVAGSSTDLLVSRGLGNSAFPLRLGNRPHLILLTLHPTTS